MQSSITPEFLEMLKAELRDLDQQYVNIGRRKMRPSQCYRIDVNPLHLLFNTNCPDELKRKLEAIVSKYTGKDESSA